MRIATHPLLVSLSLLAAVAVTAEGVAAPKKKVNTDVTTAKSSDLKGGAAKAMSPYDAQITEAHKSFAAGSAGGAIEEAIVAYRKAIAMDPNRPEGHLFLAGALYHKGDFAGAEEALSTAANRARASKAFTNYLGKALMLTATVKDAQAKPEEAKTAWAAYAGFAKDNPDQEYPKGAGDNPPMLIKVWPASAADRQAKIDGYEKLTADYAKVKELVMQRQKELGMEPKKAAK
ncbi:MAG: hypothetical protein NVSMB1_12350 [Polyangiales bacterium]